MKSWFRTVTVLLALALAAAPPSAAFAQGGSVLSPSDIVAIDRAQDGHTVTVSGEAIGEDLRAGGEHRWVNILGGGTAVGIWMTNEQAATIRQYGRWGVTGDTVRVTGVLHVACGQHAGEFDVHAETVEIVQTGRIGSRPAEAWKAAVGLVGIGAFVALTRVYRTRRERRLG